MKPFFEEDLASPTENAESQDHHLVRQRDMWDSRNLFLADPSARSAITAATGLSDDALSRVFRGLADSGLALAVRPGADTEARYAHALTLIRIHGYSVRGAAAEVGIDQSNLRKRILKLGDDIPDAEKRHTAAEERILTLAEEMSELAAEKLLAAIEQDRLRTSELVKAYSAATNQVAVKRRWNQPPPAAPEPPKKSALRELVDALQKQRDENVIDVTPRNDARE